MSHENIFLDDETYLKRNHSLDQLVEIERREDSK